ncbi:MAG: transcription initiation factor IIB family protein [Nitrososphaerota archaeon]
MVYIVKYERDGIGKSVLFVDIRYAEAFCKKLLRRGIKAIIEIEEGSRISSKEWVENLFKIYKEFIDLPNEVIEKAREICDIAFKEGIHHGYSIEYVVASSIYASYKILKIPINIIDILKAYPILERRNLLRCYRSLVKKLYLKIPIIGKEEYINAIANKLNLDKETIEKAYEIFDIIKNVDLFKSRNPIVLSASILYIASDKKYTQENFSNMVGITPLSLRNTIEEIELILKEYSPNDYYELREKEIEALSTLEYSNQLKEGAEKPAEAPAPLKETKILLSSKDIFFAFLKAISITMIIFLIYFFIINFILKW